MLDHETAALLGGGCALIVAAVDADGGPHALRGWGVHVVGDDPLVLHVLLDAHERDAIGHLDRSRPVAVTAADVRTLRSVQLKGRSGGIEPATADDAGRLARYVDAFFGDIEATDGTPRSVLSRLLPDPAELVRLAVEVDDRFDQTPGPSAGRPVETTT